MSMMSALVKQNEQVDLVYPPGMTIALILNDVHGKSNPDQIISGCSEMLIADTMLLLF